MSESQRKKKGLLDRVCSVEKTRQGKIAQWEEIGAALREAAQKKTERERGDPKAKNVVGTGWKGRRSGRSLPFAYLRSLSDLKMSNAARFLSSTKLHRSVPHP